MEYISISSGSKGNCHLLKQNSTSVLIDAGLSGKYIMDAIKMHDIEKENIKALFITHEHTDHIKGAGIISRKLDIPIYATKDTWDILKFKLGDIPQKNIRVIKNKDNIVIDDLKISSVPIKHDAVDPVAYKVCDGKKNVSIVTDLGIITQEVFDFMLKSEMIILEANHDINMLDAGPYSYELKRRIKSNFGHLSNDSAGKVSVDLVKKGTKKILLAHLSEQNNMPLIAYQSVLSILGENSIKVGSDIELSVLKQNIVSEKIAI